jgi:hypothetical protein
MFALYANESWLQIVLLTGVIGGGAAWLAASAIAQTWRPYWHALCYLALLAVAVRFFHFALLGGDLLSLPSYLVDVVWFIAVGSLAFRFTRTAQMVRQYPWLYQRTSLLSWCERHQDAEKSV